MTRADLPDPKTRRWVASRKALVVKGVLSGLISRATALDMYALSDDEFAEWETAITSYGEKALRATAIQRYKQS